MGPQQPNLPRNLAVVAVGAINQDQTVVVEEAGKVEDAEKEGRDVGVVIIVDVVQPTNLVQKI